MSFKSPADTAKAVAKFMNEIVGYMETRLGEQIMENMMKNISVDWLFDYFFKGTFDKPHEHKEECLVMTVAWTNAKLDSICENLI